MVFFEFGLFFEFGQFFYLHFMCLKWEENGPKIPKRDENSPKILEKTGRK